MAMFDINGEEFFVGDTLKVIKEDLGFKVGDLVVCSHDDGSEYCRFNEVGGFPQGVEGIGLWMSNNKLQKL